jgi:hypothetical protein
MRLKVMSVRKASRILGRHWTNIYKCLGTVDPISHSPLPACFFATGSVQACTFLKIGSTVSFVTMPGMFTINRSSILSHSRSTASRLNSEPQPSAPKACCNSVTKRIIPLFGHVETSQKCVYRYLLLSCVDAQDSSRCSTNNRILYTSSTTRQRLLYLLVDMCGDSSSMALDTSNGPCTFQRCTGGNFAPGPKGDFVLRFKL